ncbi:MAG: lipid-binding protein [Flammeovirgaceae bacterium]|nr:lipid-binding protein [Flammeovirgaceae bacterium]MBR08513.1 lipid-binding protein [Rickettsiales bacterium]HCX21966.1 YceI family protein [Cytophagales bacterium]|tara:strand:+ start:84 stop:662 length:579 start_codon:yes stop_codon:yes gene_type:complete
MLQSLLISLSLMVSSGEGIKAAYTVDTEKSTVEWFAEKVTGEHNGTVTLKSGEFAFADGKLTGGSFIVDMTTIDNTDLEGEWKDKLVGHLKSDDFFGVETYPTATFTMKSAKKQGGNKYLVSGDMTIKGITKSIEFPAEVVVAGDQVIATATLTIDRSKYNVKYGSGSFFENLGDKTIYDNFDLKIKIVSSK